IMAGKTKFVQATTTLFETGAAELSRGGLPLGGLGAGKLEFTSTAAVTNITTNNNLEAPICDGYASSPAKIVPGGVEGIFWAIHWDGKTTMLKSQPPAGTAGVLPADLEYDAKFPVVTYRYNNLKQLNLALTAFSGLVIDRQDPDGKDSSLPGNCLTFELENRAPGKKDFVLYYSFKNLCGMTGYFNNKYQGFNDNRDNQIHFIDDDKYPGMWMGCPTDKAEPRANGNYTVLVDCNKDYQIGHRTWNNLGHLWAQMEANRALDRNEHGWFEGDNGVLSIRGRLTGGETTSIHLATSWFFPHLTAQDNPAQDYGHIYEHWFANSTEVATYLLDHRVRLFAATQKPAELLFASNLPEWLKYKLLDDLFPLYTNSWYTKDKRFIISEAVTNMGGMLGTIDQRNASQAPYLMFFPEIWKSELKIFLEKQVKPGDANQFGEHYDFSTGKCDLIIDQSGAIPHHVGGEGLENYSITPAPAWLAGHWPDLLSGYVLQWYLYYCFTNDRYVKDTAYASCKRVLEFLDRLDFDRDGIPELWGVGSSSYDNHSFPYYGVMPYAATLYLAALKAMKKMAVLFGEADYAAQLQKKFDHGQKTVEAKTWNGEYFITWCDDSYQNWATSDRAHAHQSHSIHISTLAGQWYASMMGLGYLLDKDKVQKTISKIAQHNHAGVKGGGAIEFFPATSEQPAFHTGCWPHYSQAYFAALAIYENEKDAGLEQLLKLWNVVNHCGARWECGLCLDGAENDLVSGRWYMTNTVSWFDLLAISGVFINLPAKEFTLAPNLPAAFFGKLSAIPFITDKIKAVVDFELTGSGFVSAFTVKEINQPLTFDKIKIKSDRPAVTVYFNAVKIPVTYKKEDEYLTIFAELTFAKADDKLT
ncbi:MAG: GH116 family glycosyl hydrolase, partial [bacterium]